MNLKRYLPMLAALAVVMVTLTGGIAAAQTTTTSDTTTTTSDTETAELPQSQTFTTVNNDTESLRVVAMETTAPLSVTVTAIYENGTESEVSTGTLDTSADSTVSSDTFSYQIGDAQTHPDYRVNVTDDSSDSTTATAESIEIEKLQAMSGGGGLLPSGSNLSGGMILGGLLIVLALGGLLMVMRGIA